MNAEERGEGEDRREDRARKREEREGERRRM